MRPGGSTTPLARASRGERRRLKRPRAALWYTWVRVGVRCVRSPRRLCRLGLAGSDAPFLESCTYRPACIKVQPPSHIPRLTESTRERSLRACTCGARTARLWLGTEHPSGSSAPRSSPRLDCDAPSGRGLEPRVAQPRFAEASTPIGPRREPSRSARRRASLARRWLSSSI
jgi:hypothetical protein